MADTIRYEMQLRRRRAKRAKESQREAREARNERLAFGFSCFFARSLAPASTQLELELASFSLLVLFFKSARELYLYRSSLLFYMQPCRAALCVPIAYSTTPNEMHTFTFLRIASLNTFAALLIDSLLRRDTRAVIYSRKSDPLRQRRTDSLLY